VLLYQWLLKSGDFYFGDLGILRTAVTKKHKPPAVPGALQGFPALVVAWHRDMFFSPCPLELVKQLPGPGLVLTDSPGGFATHLILPAGIHLLPFLRGQRPASALAPFAYRIGRTQTQLAIRWEQRTVGRQPYHDRESSPAVDWARDAHYRHKLSERVISGCLLATAVAGTPESPFQSRNSPLEGERAHHHPRPFVI